MEFCVEEEFSIELLWNSMDHGDMLRPISGDDGGGDSGGDGGA